MSKEIKPKKELTSSTCKNFELNCNNIAVLMNIFRNQNLAYCFKKICTALQEIFSTEKLNILVL